MVVNPVELDKDKITVKVGEKLDRDFVIEILIEYGFGRAFGFYRTGTIFIEGSDGGYFFFGNGRPYRIEMDDDKVESIRIFDPESQLSIKNVDFSNILAQCQYQV